MKYELNKEQVDALKVIIDSAQIPGKAAELIVGLKQTLATPVKEKKLEDKKD